MGRAVSELPSYLVVEPGLQFAVPSIGSGWPRSRRLTVDGSALVAVTRDEEGVDRRYARHYD